MTKLEKIIYDAIPFDGAFSEIVKGESAKAIASAVLPLIEEAFEAGIDWAVDLKGYSPGPSTWLSSNITGDVKENGYDIDCPDCTSMVINPGAGPIVGIPDDTPFNNAR